MAVVKNITIDQYTSWRKTYTLYDKNRSPVDLTNYTPLATIKKSPQTANIAFFTCEVIDPAANGQILMSLDYDSLLEVKPGNYKYDILLVSNTGERIRAVEGDVILSGNITQ